MNFFTNFDWSAKSFAKLAGGVLLGFVGLALVAMLISFSLRTVLEPFYGQSYTKDYYGDTAYPESVRSLGGVPPMPGGEYVAEDAESYEVSEYSADFRPRRKDKVCDAVAELKSRTDIIFEQSSSSDESCRYRFKVKKALTDEILTLLDELGAEDISANTYTIQRAVEGLADELTILQRKLDGIEATLTQAQSDYDELTRLATRKQDVESLTKLIDLKLNTIERLADERRQTADHISRLTKARAEQLQSIEYTTFSVSVVEERFIYWQQIADSWRYEIRTFITTFNDLLQSLTVTLVTYLLRVIQALIYFALSVAVLKLVWIIARRIWRLGDQ